MTTSTVVFTDGACERNPGGRGGWGWVVDANTLYIAVGQKDVWRISMSNSCLAAKWSSDPLITRTVGGSDMVCRPLDLDLKAGGSGGVSPCIISKIEKMTPAEVAAIPKKLRP